MDTKVLIAKIRNYESQASYAARTNEQQLPKIKSTLQQALNLKIDEADNDLLLRLNKLSNEVDKLQPDNLSAEELERIRTEVIDIRDTLVQRYKGRLNVYENRYNDL